MINEDYRSFISINDLFFGVKALTTMFSSIIMIFLSVVTVVWSVPFILFKCIGLHLYRINDNQKVTMALKKLKCVSTIKTSDKPNGFIFGYYYVGYISEIISYTNNGQTINYEIYILISDKMHDSITSHDYMFVQKNVNTSIKIYERKGNYYNFSYDSRRIDINNISPRPQQKKYIDTICSEYRKKNFSVAMIYGKPGSGKSMIPMFLTKELNGSYCDSFTPTDPGDNIAMIYNTICPTFDNPMIIVLEEFDIMINKVHNGLVQQHKAMPTQIHDKTNCNQFFDKINRGFYPFLILILTSNKSTDYIDMLDSSYIRPGRVDLKLAMI